MVYRDITTIIKDMRTSLSKIAKRASAITLLLITLFALPTSAQGVAEVWLDKATEKLQNKGAEISFRIDEDGMRLSGKLLMEGNKFYYDAETIKIWYDGTTQWTLQTDAGYSELYISAPNVEDLQLINPYLLLNHYKDLYTIADGGEKIVHGKPTHKIELMPNDENQEVANVDLYIYSDGNLAAIDLTSSSGYSYEIEVRSMRSGLTFPKNTFTYQEKEYPADEIIDMR